MPSLCEGTEITGELTDEIQLLGITHAVPVIAGAGDNAAGAIAMGVINEGQAMLSLSTSGILYIANDAFRLIQIAVYIRLSLYPQHLASNEVDFVSSKLFGLVG